MKRIITTILYLSKQLLGLFTVCYCLGLIIFLALDYAFSIEKLKNQKQFSQLVVDKHGRPLRAFADKQGVWRYPVVAKNVSPLYIEALINYEDRLFWQHRGVNPFSMLRAVKQWIVNGKPVSGGSTITMQVARLLDPHSKSLAGKLWQIFRAFQLEFYFSKKEILNLYLNYAPFGGPIEGVETAAFTFLGKSAKDLTHAEAALLAVLPQSPSRLRPDRYPDRAKKSRNKVLNRLANFGIWENDIIAHAKQESVFAEYNSKPLIAPLLARKLVNENPNETLIETTIDLEIQLPLAELVKNYLHQFSATTSASVMLMENKNLNVVAYVGAADFANPHRFGHIDMNSAIRSPGSTLKPFLYALALDEGLIHSQSLLQDVPLDFGNYSPQNFSQGFAGPVSMTEALQRSLNIPAVQVLSHLTPQVFAASLENAGLDLHFPDNSAPSLSLALGGVGVELNQLIAAYRALSAKGMSGKPRYLKSDSFQERYLMSPEAAWIVADILAQVPLQPYQKSPYLKKQKQWVAHKTGTSYGHRDAWMVAVGYQYTLAVWIGKPDGTPSPGEFGYKTTAPLVTQIISLLKPSFKASPVIPEKVVVQQICWPLGLTRSVTTLENCHQSKSAYLINSIAPQTLTQTNEYQENPMPIYTNQNGERRIFPHCYQGENKQTNIALWPRHLEYWLPKKYRRKELIPPLIKECEKNVNFGEELVILGIKNNSRIKLSKVQSQQMPLSLSVINSQEQLSWLLNGHFIQKSKSDQPMVITNLKKGKHNITVFNSQGQHGELQFEVI